MEPLSALAVATSVVQFVDYTSRVINHARKIYRSSEAKSSTELDIEKTSSDLIELSTEIQKKLRSSEPSRNEPSKARDIMMRLCEECNKVADELIKTLSKLQVTDDLDPASKALYNIKHDVRRRWSYWKTDPTKPMKDQLGEIRAQMMMAVLTSLWEDAQERGSDLNQLRDYQARLSNTRLQAESPEGTVSQEELTNLMSDKQARDHLINAYWSTGILPQTTNDKLDLLRPFDENEESLKKAFTVSLASLRYDSMRNREKAISKAHQKTFRWIFEEPKLEQSGEPLWHDFSKWMSGPAGDIYWVAGKPGAGKSTLMRYIFAQKKRVKSCLSTWLSGLPLLTSSVYLWNTGSNMQKSHEGLFRTILCDCIEQFPRLFLKIAPRRITLLQIFGYDTVLPEWTIDELQSCVENLISLCGVSVKLALFIDGLDELEGDHDKLVKLVKQMNSNEGVKICVSSRPWNIFSDTFCRNPSLRLEKLTKDDIEHYVRHEFEECEGFRDLRETFEQRADQLIRDIVERAQGVFLWVTLVVKGLRQNLTEGDSLPELEATFNSLPDELYKLFDNIWYRIDAKHHRNASRYFQILEASIKLDDILRYHTLWLMDEACPFDFDVADMTTTALEGARKITRRRLNSRTRDLLEIYPDGHVNYLHRTAREWVTGCWDRVCLKAPPPSFSPFLTLANTITIQLPFMRTSEYIHKIDVLLQCASLACHQIDSSAFYQLLDQVDFMISRSSGQPRKASDKDLLLQSTTTVADHREYFIHVCAIIPLRAYIQHKITNCSDPTPWSTRTLVEAAVLGQHDYNLIRRIHDWGGLEEYSEERKALVEFLLLQSHFTVQDKRHLLDKLQNRYLTAAYHKEVKRLLEDDILKSKESKPRRLRIKGLFAGKQTTHTNT